jgi:hypothetical protein
MASIVEDAETGFSGTPGFLKIGNVVSVTMPQYLQTR